MIIRTIGDPDGDCYGRRNREPLKAVLPGVAEPALAVCLLQERQPWRALAASLGGTISGEHGIGHKRKPYLHMVLSAPAIELMRAIKRAWDPNNILNPGKIFDV